MVVTAGRGGVRRDQIDGIGTAVAGNEQRRRDHHNGQERPRHTVEHPPTTRVQSTSG
jgi:hypothetical protein